MPDVDVNVHGLNGEVDAPYSNREQVSMQGQLLYKLAALEAAMSAGFRRLDEKMDRFQNDLHDSQLHTDRRISDLDSEMKQTFAFKRNRIDNVEKEIHRVSNFVQEEFSHTKSNNDQRFADIETWRQVAMAKVGVLVGAVVIVWTFIAPTIRDILGIAQG